MFKYTLCLLSLGLVGLAAPAIAAAPPVVPVVCGVMSKDVPRSTFQCRESSGRITPYSVNAGSKFTLNGAPMGGWVVNLHLGDQCSVLVTAPPYVATADCKR